MSVINEQALHARDVEALGLPDARYDEAITNLLDTLSEPIAPKQDAWPSLIPFGSDVNLPGMRASLLPGFAGVFAKELAVETETPLEVALSLTLVACALAACRRFKVQVKPRYFEPLNLWVIAALSPGNRKSAVQAAATKPLTEWQSEQSLIIDEEVIRVSSRAKSMNALIAHKRSELAKEKNRQRQIELMDELADLEADVPQIPKPPLLWTSDATPERLGMLLADNAERMAWLSSEGGVFDMLSGRYSAGIPNLDLMLKSHSGDPERVERATRPPVDLHQPLLTIGISPQPSVLEGLAAKPGFRGRGLLGRFLYLLPTSLLGYRSLTTQPMSDATQDAYCQGLRLILDTPPADNKNPRVMHVLTLSPEAFNEWFDFACHIESQFRPGKSLELLTDWGGKAPGAAARIAGVLHCIKYAGRTDLLEIDLETMKDALEIMAVFVQHSIHAMGIMGNDPNIAAAKLVWEWLHRGQHRATSQREIFNALRGRFPTMSKLMPAFDILEERGYIKIKEPKQEGAGRPPSPMVIARPELLRDQP